MLSKSVTLLPSIVRDGVTTDLPLSDVMDVLTESVRTPSSAQTDAASITANNAANKTPITTFLICFFIQIQSFR